MSPNENKESSDTCVQTDVHDSSRLKTQTERCHTFNQATDEQAYLASWKNLELNVTDSANKTLRHRLLMFRGDMGTGHCLYPEGHSHPSSLCGGG